jgi:DNA sulfur modification protein DndB
MTENLRIELLGKLINEKEIGKQLKLRKRDCDYETIKVNQREEYIENGWELYKENKSSITMKKLKPNDIDFEDRVWALFALLGYQFMNRDRNFHLPYDKNNPTLTQQIDVFAKDEETLLIIECKASSQNKRGDFKKELEAMAGKIEGLRKSIQFLFPNVKHKVKFIFATRNYSLSPEDQDRLKNIGGIHFNEENIDYFYSLYSQLGVSAKYQLLGSLFDGQDIPEMNNLVPAVEGKMGGYTYYSFSIEPEKLLKIGYVLHRNKANINMMPTYQRLIKKTRLKSIYEFIENGGYFPNSIVISIDSQKLNFDRANTQVDSTLSKVGILHLPKKYRSAYIIDGQHRLYGYSDSEYKVTNTIPVVAFINLSRSEQVKLFMQINENQKAVSKDLRNTLNADLLWDSDNKIEQQRALCSRISIFLGENRESALFDKVSIGEDKKIITTQAIENALKKSMFLGKVSKTKIEELGSFYNGNLEDTYERLCVFLNDVFAYFSENIEDEWNKENDGMLLINKGIYGIILISSDIVDYLNNKLIIRSLKDNTKVIYSEVKSYLDPIINYIKNLDDDAKNELKASYGAGGETRYWRTFQKSVNDTYSDFSPDGMEEYFKKEAKLFNDKAISFIRDIEIEFKKDFKERLEEFFGKKWFEKGVPPKIADKALVDALAKNRELEDDDEEVEPWDCLTIIAYREIALKNWQNIFEKEYTKPGEEKISGGKDEKTKWMVRLERIRNQNFHSYSVSEEELDFLEELHDWICKKELRNLFQSK